MKKILAPIGLLVALLGSAAMPASASLIGRTVDVENVFSGSTFDEQLGVVVGPGIELINFGGIWDIDITANTIEFLLNPNPTGITLGLTLAADDEYIFRFQDLIPMPGPITVAALTSSIGFNLTPVVASASDSVQITFLDDTIIDLGLSAGISITTVPAPATLTLFAFGLASLGWKRRKQA